jgi:hypothetical protein
VLLTDDVLSLLLYCQILHVLNTEEQPDQVWRASCPWLYVNVRKVLAPFSEVLRVGNLDVLVDLNLCEVEDE